MGHPPLPPTDLNSLQDESPHYVHSVTDMGEEREVVAQEDIYAANGMKLLAKGARINRSQCDRLSLHKLRVPLDLLLATEQPMDAAQLASEGNRLLVSDPALGRLAERTGDPLGFKHSLGALTLSGPLAFRMTVMHEKRNGLFEHSLRTSLICHSLAVRMGLSERDKQDLLLAALCHDLGEMHTDPALLEPGHHITAAERRYIHVHPITGYVVLRELPGLSTNMLLAVLHHHERLDGSGYPYGLSGENIHPLAKLLCVAEVMEAVVRRSDLQRLDVLLRLNHRRLDPAAVGALRELLRADTISAQSVVAENDATTQLTHVAEVLASWQAIQGSGAAKAASSPDLGFLRERMTMLRSLVLQSGIDLDDIETLLELAREESIVLSELQATLDELEWLMIDIANEIERRLLSTDIRSPDAIDDFVALLRAS